MTSETFRHKLFNFSRRFCKMFSQLPEWFLSAFILSKMYSFARSLNLPASCYFV